MSAPPRLSRLGRFRLLLERTADRRLSPIGVWVMRRTKGSVAGPWKVEALVLTTRGRRTGKTRAVVLRYYPDGDTMVVAAANDGGRTHPGWFHNLRADATARVEVKGRSFDVRAEELPADEAARWWARMMREWPNYESFGRATDRAIPIVRLVPVRVRAQVPAAGPPR